MTSIASHFATPACGRWSAFAADDSDCDMGCDGDGDLDMCCNAMVGDMPHPPPSPSFSVRMRDPLLELMDDPAFEWGIISDVEDEMGLHGTPAQAPAPEPVSSWDNMFHNGWHVIEVMPGYYSTRNLNDDEFERMMSWLYATGWDVSTQSRRLNIVSCHHCHTGYASRQWSWSELEEDDGPQAAQNAAERHSVPKNPCTKCGTHHWISKTPCPSSGPAAKGLSKPGTDIGRRDGAPVPRFCNLGTKCPKPGCRYVHGDTIPRINALCRFADTCSGEKRACCLHMHHGEKFVSGMVLKRPGTN